MAYIGVYLNDKEEQALVRLLEEHPELSRNVSIRIGVRAITGLPVPDWAEDLLRETVTA